MASSCRQSLTDFCDLIRRVSGCRCCRALKRDGTLVERMALASSVPCGCEKTRLRCASPGIVKDDEELFFMVPHPGAMLGDKLNPTFLTQVDENGLSTLRQAAKLPEFDQTLSELKERWEPKARKFHGVAVFKTSKVRYAGNERMCCVYDTALPGKPHHGDIAGPKLEASSKSALERLKRARLKQLVDAVDRFEPAATFRGGALRKFAE